MTAIADTYGWDTVLAISIDVVNDCLQNLPASAFFSRTTPVKGGTAAVDWAFGNWRVSDVPGGNRLEVTLDFAEGSRITIVKDGASTITPLDVPPWSCVVTFEAHFDADDPRGRLVANTGSGKAWASVQVEADAQEPDFATMTALKTLVEAWFSDPDSGAVELFAQEFAAVDLGAKLSDLPELAFLRPRVLGFAGNVMADGVTRAIGILAMTGEDFDAAVARARGARLELSPYAIAANARVGFLISGGLFLRHLLMPACAGTFGGDPQNPSASLELYGTGSARLRNHKALAFTQTLDGKHQPARIEPEALDFRFEGDRLRMSIRPMNVQTDHAGFSLNATIEQTYLAKLAPKPGASGETVFLLHSAAPTEPKVDVVREHWVNVVEIIGATLAGALSAALAVVSFKGPLAQKLDAVGAKIWARVIAAVAVFIASEVLANIPLFIDAALSGQTHRLPDFGKFLNLHLDRIAWPGGQAIAFVPVAASFGDGLHITLEPA